MLGQRFEMLDFNHFQMNENLLICLEQQSNFRLDSKTDKKQTTTTNKWFNSLSLNLAPYWFTRIQEDTKAFLMDILRYDK